MMFKPTFLQPDFKAVTKYYQKAVSKIARLISTINIGCSRSDDRTNFLHPTSEAPNVKK